jgi:hypothetical protein
MSRAAILPSGSLRRNIMGTEKQHDDHHDHDHDHDKHCRDHDHDHDKHCRDHDDDKGHDGGKCREHYKYREYWKYRDSHGGKCHDHDHDKDDDDKKREYPSHHIHELEKTIKTLADKLAELGRGAHLLELQRIIRCPGWTSAAELAFVNAILDHLSVEVRTIERLQADLVEASRKVKKDRH